MRASAALHVLIILFANENIHKEKVGGHVSVCACVCAEGLSVCVGGLV